MKLLLLFAAGFSLTSCLTRSEEEGVKIDHTLTEQQDYTTNRRLCELITNSLHREPAALQELLRFECGGAAGCYDLGDVITQVIYRVGEKDAVRMIKDFSPQQKNDLRNFIEVGLEYGWQLDKNFPNQTIEQQFPLLSRNLPR